MGSPVPTRRRVLHVVTGLQAGGAEIMLARVAARSRHESQVISLTGVGSISARLTEDDVQWLALDLRGPFTAVCGLLLLARRARRYKPDVVMTWLYHSDLIGGIVGRFLLRVPVIWVLHNTGLHATGSRRTTRVVLQLLSRLSQSLPTRIITCSTAAQAAHVELGYPATKFELIANGVDLDEYRHRPSLRADTRVALGLGADEFALIRVARWDAQKDFPSLLEAMAVVVTHCPNARLVLVGKGCEANNAELVQMIARFNLEEFTIMLGLRADVPALLAACDVAVSSSLNEAAPLSVIEALASGLPQVVTDVGDCAVTVGAAGIVVPPAKPEMLAAAIERIVDDPDLVASLRAAARERAQSFDIARAVSAYDNLVEVCVREHHL